MKIKIVKQIIFKTVLGFFLLVIFFIILTKVGVNFYHYPPIGIQSRSWMEVWIELPKLIFVSFLISVFIIYQAYYWDWYKKNKDKK